MFRHRPITVVWASCDRAGASIWASGPSRRCGREASRAAKKPRVETPFASPAVLQAVSLGDLVSADCAHVAVGSLPPPSGRTAELRIPRVASLPCSSAQCSCRHECRSWPRLGQSSASAQEQQWRRDRSVSIGAEARRSVPSCQRNAFQIERMAPPSTGIIAPVVKDAAGDSRNAAARPNSSGSPYLRSGIR